MHYFISPTKQFCKVGTFIISILQMGKLRFHEVNRLAQSQTALSYKASTQTLTESNTHCSRLPTPPLYLCLSMTLKEGM